MTAGTTAGKAPKDGEVVMSHTAGALTTMSPTRRPTGGKAGCRENKGLCCLDARTHARAHPRQHREVKAGVG